MMNGQLPGATVDTSAPHQLVRAAAALRWKRPDLTATLAELALDAADDAATWVTAAGWLLHGRTVLGDGRQVACDLIDGLARWDGGAGHLMTGPQGRRLRVELAGPARRAGDPAGARTLLAADPGADSLDGELHADVLTELARCAVDDAPDTADPALDAAEQAWLATGCESGVAAVLLLRAARDRRAGRPAAAAVGAFTGLARVDAGGRRAGGAGSDHLAAALTAEWIAALVDAGRVEEARSEAVPAARRLLTTARPSRQLAGLRLAVARVAAVGGTASGTADDVLTALEPAAQDAADADVPELESACRSMLGELHEAAGRLDAALGAVRAAMAAERRDHDRAARLRTRLAAATATWAGSPSGHGADHHATWGLLTDPATGGSGDLRTEADRDDRIDDGIDATRERRPRAADRPAPAEPEPARAERARARAGNWSTATGAGRRARRLAAEAAAPGGWSDAPLPELGSAPPEPYGASATDRSESRGPGPNGAGRTSETVAAGSPGAPVSARDERRWDDALSSTARFAPMPDLPSHASEARDGAGGAAPDANWFADEATAGGGVPRRRERPAVADPAEPGHEPGHSRPTVDREAGRVAHRAGHGEAPMGRATSATSGGRSAHTDTGRAVAVGATSASGSLIGDALLRELLENGLPARRTEPSRVSGVSDTVVFELDPRHDSTVAVSPSGTPSPNASPRTGTGQVAPAIAGAAAAPHPPRPDERRDHGVPTGAGRDGSPAVHTVRVAAPLDTRRHQHNGHGRPPGSNGSHRPEGPAADHGGNPGDSPDTGSPGAGSPGPGATSRPRGAARSATSDTDGLGLGDLLAGALAAYRNI
jgi:hypothetical protein